MKNRKGFTLIELLVAITIIGVIMLMVLPAIHNLQRENQEKKFDNYERAVLEAAKAYEDQYEEDLFGRSDNGCASIDYEALIQKKLLATTKISGYECNYSGNDNGIIIRKVNKTSFYEVYLTCKDAKGEKKLTDNSGYSSIKDENCVAGVDETPPQLDISCDATPIMGVAGDNLPNPPIYYYSATNDEGEKRLPKLKVKASDKNSGLEKNQYVTYEWKIYERNLNQLENDPSSTEKNKTTFNIKDGAGSTSSKNMRIIEAFKKTNKTGKAIIDIRAENIVDRAGNKVDSQNVTKCTYYYDNAKPEMEIKITGDSGREYSTTSGEWIREPITTTVTVTDATGNNIYSGIDMENFKRNNTKEQLSAKDETTATHTYTLRDTNRKATDTYRVCDKVGNCTTQTVIIRVDTIYPVCKSRDGDSNWRNKDITINGDCEDQGDPANYSGCRRDVYSKLYADEQSITNATAGEACDNAGNCVTCSEDQPVHIDKTPPNCTTEGESTKWAASRTINFNCDDPENKGVRSGCTKTTFEKIKYTKTTKISQQTWNIEDKAGNTKNCTKNKVKVYMDNTPPNCTLNSPTNVNKPSGITLNATCNDSDGELLKVEWAPPYGSPLIFNTDIPEGTSEIPLSLTTTWPLSFTFNCYNSAGLSCSVSANVEVSTCTITRTKDHSCHNADCSCISCSKGTVKNKKTSYRGPNYCYATWTCKWNEDVTDGPTCGYYQK